MKMKEIYSVVFIAALLLILTVDSVVPPRRRAQRRYGSGRSAFLERARITLSGRSSTWKPSSRKCCKVGERAARRSLSCDMSEHVVYKKNTSTYRKTAKDHREELEAMKRRGLPMKIERCAPLYTKYYVKCCTVRERFLSDLKNCRQLPRRKRKMCRVMVKRKYS